MINDGVFKCRLRSIEGMQHVRKTYTHHASQFITVFYSTGYITACCLYLLQTAANKKRLARPSYLLAAGLDARVATAVYPVRYAESDRSERLPQDIYRALRLLRYYLALSVPLWTYTAADKSSDPAPDRPLCSTARHNIQMQLRADETEPIAAHQILLRRH